MFFTSLPFIHSRTFQDQDDKTYGLNLRFCLCSSLLELYLHLQYTPSHINIFAESEAIDPTPGDTLQVLSIAYEGYLLVITFYPVKRDRYGV